MMLIGVLALLPALGLVLYNGAQLRAQAAEQAKEDALRLARLAASNQDALIEGARQTLIVIAQTPQVDGLEVLRRVKAHSNTRVIPVVVPTSSREECDIVDSYTLGVNSYIVKPVDFEKFTEAVRSPGMCWLLLNQPPSG